MPPVGGVTFALYRPRAVRVDVAPFVVLYVVGFAAYFLLPPNLIFAANLFVPAAGKTIKSKMPLSE